MLHLSRRNEATSFDLGEIGRVLRDLEARLGEIAAFVSASAREAGGAVPDRVSGALSDASELMRTSLRRNVRSIGGQATRMGTHAWHEIEDGIVRRPIVALAIAAGIGFLIGALNRR